MLTILEIVKLCNKKAVCNWKLVIQIKQLLFLKTTNVAKKLNKKGRRGGGLGEEMKLAAIEGWLVLKQKSSRRHSEVAGSTLPRD